MSAASTKSPAPSVGSSPENRPRRGALPASLWAGVALASAALAAVRTGVTWRPAADGLPDPGRAVVDGIALLRLATLLSGGLTVGFLMAGLGLDPGATSSRLGPAGRRDLGTASRAAYAWAAANLALAMWTLAEVLGVGLSGLASPGLVATYAWDVPTTRAYLLAGALSLAVAIGLPWVRSLGAAAGLLVVAVTAVGLPSLTGHAPGLGGHALALVSGFVHTTTAVVWAGTVVALATNAVRREARVREELARFGFVAVTCVCLLGLSGLGSAATRLDSASELFTTQYGRMVLVKTVAFGIALLLGWLIRRRVRGGGWRPAGYGPLLAETAATGVALGVAVILARSAFPRLAVELPSYGESLIGYAYPPEPTLGRVALGWHPEYVFLAGSLIAAGLYVIGVASLRRRGDRWPAGRLVSWLVGLAAVVWATCAGVAWYAPVSFALHMISHMVLAMLAPVFLVMGAPVTLALRVLPASGAGRGPREWLTWLLHSRFTRFVTHPAYVLVIYTVGLYGLYYSQLYAWLMGSHLGHLVMQVHFLAAGYLFYWVVIGIDPAPRKLPYSARLILLMASLVIHSFFAVPMMMAESVMIADWYAVVQPPWLTDPLADTRLAGGIAWGFGEIPTLVVAMALAIQWARSDERDARRRDRRAELDGDAELRAYNERLARVNRAGTARPGQSPDRTRRRP